MSGTIPTTLGDILDSSFISRDSPNIPSELLHLYLPFRTTPKMLLNLKCVTLWVRIYVDMSGTPSTTMIISGTLMHIMIPTHITNIFIVRTTRITNIHLSHCFSIRYNARGETFLVTRHVLFYSFRIPMFLYDHHHDQVSGRTMTNTVIPERAQSVSLHRQE